jgi:hypothetical protein
MLKAERRESSPNIFVCKNADASLKQIQSSVLRFENLFQ